MPEIERALYRVLADIATSQGCRILAVGSMPDHVHIFLRIPATIVIFQLVQKLKGASSHFVNDRFFDERSFKWMGFYGAFSVSRWDVSQIMAYINNQKEHHASNEIYAELEGVFEHYDGQPGNE